MQQSVIDFISHARGKGMDHATIRVLLLSAGWKEKDVAQALAAEGLDIPVPEPAGGGSARDTFLYLLIFTSLYTVVISLVMLLFEYVDIIFIDAATRAWDYSSDYQLSSIRWLLAVLMVASPPFFWLSRLTLREIARNPEKARSAVRRWLTYLTLFVSAVTIFSDLMALLYSFIEGELSTRFVVKVVVLFAVTGFAFLYYLLSLRTPKEAAP